VKIGHLTFKSITVACVQGESPSHKIGFCSTGGFSSVYFALYYGRYLAFKCYPIKEDSETEVVLSRAIHEYCMLKLASNLKMGPYVQNFIGVDVVIYETCIEFAMEMGEGLQRREQFDGLGEDLLASLLQMHRVKMLHLDIKPDNVCFSPFFNKFVFIDFGLSRMVREDLGEKSKSQFVGSLQFCSPEMQEAYFCSEERHLDLYFNDLHCLRQTLAEALQARESCVGEEERMHEVVDVTEDHLLVLLKYLLFNLQTQTFVQQFERNKFRNIEHFGSRLVSFLRELNESQLFKEVESYLTDNQ
jgi:serine/threonine protein kinase